MLKLPLFALTLAACATTSSTTFYPLDELKALDAPETRDELLAHAMEVAPSKRTDEWRGLVERAAIATLADLEVKNLASAERALALLDSTSAKFPPLKKSPAWLAKRAEVGIASFGWVLESRNSQDWVARVLEFAQRDPITPHLAQRLAEEVVLKRLIASTAKPLYDLALERDHAAACDAPGLAQVALDWALDDADFKAATSLCWKQLEATLLDAVKKTETRTAKLKLCAALAAHADAPGVKAACAVTD
jgi:hypothetical protein